MMHVTIDKARNAFVPNYRQPEFVLERGEGVYVFDADGQRYLDAIAGIAVNALGHGHPDVVAAVSEQVARLAHTSNLYWTAPAMELSVRLTEATFARRVFFCNSGAEANEALFKAARRYHFDRGSDRTEVIATTNSFHGRTMATVTLTGQPKYHEGFGPMVPGIDHVPYGDLAAMAARVNDKTAAILVEPIQGEGGVVVPPNGYLAGLRDLADTHGCLLLFDEVQTGVGRTGTFLACDHDGVVPDGVSLAKGLGAGLPIGAFLAGDALAQVLVPGTHASTFGGNPVACAAANVVVEALTEGLLDTVRGAAEHLERGLQPLIDRGLARALRGRGLLRGLELADADADLPQRARDEGLLIGMVAGSTVVRLAPPLTIEAAEIDDLVARLTRALEAR
jgi:acetylornithine/N-succinyldiaminopimelate aminotransferase